MPAVLLITNDPSAEGLVQKSLATLGYEVVTASTAEAAMRGLFTVKVDAAVVDAALGEDLEWLCQRLRGTDGALAIVFLASAGAQWLPGSLPLDSDLDEVVTKPYAAKDVREAVERALAARHRSRPSVVMIDDLQLDRATHELRGSGVQVQLTPTEFRLLEYLAQRQGAIASGEELLEKVWEFYPGTGSSELVRSHVRNLRAKIRIAAPGRELIQTVPRRGYRLA
ncbi:MAG: response regulator transcription factor [Chloroflexi bacterium]|nr:response regulator transcription factor [Chloroflexota bacterium]